MTVHEWDVRANLPFARQWLADQCHRRRLSPTQRRVAQLLLDTMPQAAFISTMEAASLAGVSQPTVTRFAATLGYPSYADFRGAVREVLRVGPPADDTPHALDPVSQEQANLEALRTTLASPVMTSAAAALGDADAVGVLGLRASAALAAHAAYFLDAVLDRVSLLAEGRVEAGLEVLAAAKRPELLVIAMPRYPEATVAALRSAAGAGIATTLVIDSRDADFCDVADEVLVAPVSTETVFDSHAAPVLLLMSLVDRIADLHPRRTQARLEDREALVAGWEHVPPRARR